MSFTPPPSTLRPLSPYFIEFQQMLTRGAQQYARLAPGASLKVTSWWRDRARNAAVGGAATSQHLIGLALDLQPTKPNATEPELARLAGVLAAAMNSVGGGLTAVNEWSSRRHVHVQKSPAGVWDAVIHEAARRGLLDTQGATGV